MTLFRGRPRTQQKHARAWPVGGPGNSQSGLDLNGIGVPAARDLPWSNSGNDGFGGPGKPWGALFGAPAPTTNTNSTAHCARRPRRFRTDGQRTNRKAAATPRQGPPRPELALPAWPWRTSPAKSEQNQAKISTRCAKPMPFSRSALPAQGVKVPEM